MKPSRFVRLLNVLPTLTTDMDEPEPVCLCGHRERDHAMTGRCRVPGCLCDRFEPVPGIGASAPA